jgi:hypothetical protein
MKKISIYLLAMLFIASVNLTSCKDDDKPEEQEELGGGDLSGIVEGTLKKGTYIIKSDIIVPAGKTLTLEPGVILAFDGDGLSPESSPELKLDGNLYAVGTAQDPILFTVTEEKRDPKNAYEGFWGGIQAASTTDYLVMQHCIVEYTGGPADGNRPDLYDAGDPRYAIHFGNPNGTMIFDHCILRHIADDGIRPQGGGKFAFTYSQFYNVGETGGEGINFKDGSVGDVAYCLFYGIATNGSKPAGRGDGVPQTNINNYNNTFINCGFRRVQAGRGGSINYESGAKGQNYNNIIANCRFGIRLRGDRLPDMDNTKFDYTMYYATDATDKDNYFPSTDVDADNNRLTSEQPNDILDQDPMFVNYPVSTDKMTATPQDAWNFKLKSDSPGKGKGKTDFSPVHSSLSAGGFTLTLPAPSADFGAFGAE